MAGGGNMAAKKKSQWLEFHAVINRDIASEYFHLENACLSVYNSKWRLTHDLPSHSGVEDGRLCDGLT